MVISVHKILPRTYILRGGFVHKKILLLLTLALLAVPLLPVYAGAALELDGKLLSDGDPVVIEGRLMVPVRPVFEELGYALSGNLEEGIVLAQKKNHKIEICLWEPKLVVNGKEMSLTAAPQLIMGKTFLSEQDLAKLLDLQNFRAKGTDQVVLFSKPELTREGVIRHLLAADRQLMRAEYYNNQEFLAQHNIAPSPKIVTRDDLIMLLGRHWSAHFIENLWAAGSRDGQYIGFFSEGSIPLLYSKELAVTELTGTGAKVEVKLPLWGNEDMTRFEERVYTLNRDKEGNLLITNVECK
ncbi:Copper amine oxidase N-terminal domain-containing protein [Desulforamulus putei DSM 12395]|uniref:Copper amine oxidase N-terminal domain-containing protein n=1 Tax=Desulforamulus putei DSM 12395 TaxID=1121429 RepID=A0A1M5CDH8_9FIRM|nr:Copper amine oxidase N-terminal domain-containing protein [Desulforamulus putei DSM 12395]